MMTTPATELEIRTSLLRRLEARVNVDERLCEEFRIESGRARIDVAVIGDTLTGYEIKSDLDSFARFSNQIHAYNRVFDSIYLVCGSKHVDHALEVLPSWWGVVAAQRDAQGKLELQTLRGAGTNPRQEAFSLASLLWRDEAFAVLISENQKPSKKASSHLLWEQIASSLSLDSVKHVVTETLAKRSYQSAEIVSAM